MALTYLHFYILFKKFDTISSAGKRQLVAGEHVPLALIRISRAPLPCRRIPKYYHGTGHGICTACYQQVGLADLFTHVVAIYLVHIKNLVGQIGISCKKAYRLSFTP